MRIEAPLEPNLNHHSSAFGGSVAALAILTGWTLVHTRLEGDGVATPVVIQTSSIRYHAPILGTFTAATAPVPAEAWDRFRRALSRRGKGRVRVSVGIEADGHLAASFEGAYVAITPP